MKRNRKPVAAGGLVILVVVLLNVIALKLAIINDAEWYWLLVGVLPLLLVGIFNSWQKKQYPVRNFT